MIDPIETNETEPTEAEAAGDGFGPVPKRFVDYMPFFADNMVEVLGYNGIFKYVDIDGMVYMYTKFASERDGTATRLCTRDAWNRVRPSGFTHGQWMLAGCLEPSETPEVKAEVERILADEVLSLAITNEVGRRALERGSGNAD